MTNPITHRNQRIDELEAENAELMDTLFSERKAFAAFEEMTDGYIKELRAAISLVEHMLGNMVFNIGQQGANSSYQLSDMLSSLKHIQSIAKAALADSERDGVESGG